MSHKMTVTKVRKNALEAANKKYRSVESYYNFMSQNSLTKIAEN